MAWSQSPTDTTAENSGELGSSKAVLGLEMEGESADRAMGGDSKAQRSGRPTQTRGTETLGVGFTRSDHRQMSSCDVFCPQFHKASKSLCQSPFLFFISCPTFVSREPLSALIIIAVVFLTT